MDLYVFSLFVEKHFASNNSFLIIITVNADVVRHDQLRQTKMTYLHLTDDKWNVMKRGKFENKSFCKAPQWLDHVKMAKQVDESI